MMKALLCTTLLGTAFVCEGMEDKKDNQENKKFFSGNHQINPFAILGINEETFNERMLSIHNGFISFIESSINMILKDSPMNNLEEVNFAYKIISEKFGETMMDSQLLDAFMLPITQKYCENLFDEKKEAKEVAESLLQMYRNNLYQGIKIIERIKDERLDLALEIMKKQQEEKKHHNIPHNFSVIPEKIQLTEENKSLIFFLKEAGQDANTIAFEQNLDEKLVTEFYNSINITN